jgi:ectoine hydroxylase-related dioxygenase (phytanoyl-CoA dioxygenase family)
VGDFVLYGPSAHAAQQVFGSKKVTLFYDQIFIKEALTLDPTPWHHDVTFWPIEGEQIASVWTSVDSVDANSSALEFIAGSHRWNKLCKSVGPVATWCRARTSSSCPTSMLTAMNTTS